MHWQTTLTVGNAEAAAVKLGMNRTMFVSPGLARLGRDYLGFTKAMLVRDPDGHVMELVEAKLELTGSTADVRRA